jgi:aminopeptidase N
MLHFFYKNDPNYAENWKNATELIVKGFQFLSTHFGKYPYPVYSIIQGGDGGMEYPMATLITGNRKLPSLVGVTIHEAAHSWYQGVLATNESLYPWMDEGFTSYASTETMANLFVGRMPGDHSDAYSGYLSIVREGKEEALDTHADHYITNYAYGTASYNKGEVYLAQLAYIIGQNALDQTLLNYFAKWKFKHPNALQFLHEAELTSGMVLDWYHEYFVETTKSIDYAITEVRASENKTTLVIKRKGLMPMPVDIEVTYKDGSTEMFYIPLDLMRGEKPSENYGGKWTVLPDWQWVNDSYTVLIPQGNKNIVSVNIDPSERMADSVRENNFVSIGGDALIIDNK